MRSSEEPSPRTTRAPSRRQSAPPVVVERTGPAGFRLRHVLLLGALALGCSWIWPRGQAAWQLHHLATVTADHAVCMAGPTGSALLKENPDALQELLRLRVLMAPPDAQPFANCRKFADQMEMSHRARQAHEAEAREFHEHRVGPGPVPAFSVSDFELSTNELAALAERAWPLARSEFQGLVVPSRSAKEAAHPSRPPRAGVGSGLPTRRVHYRSTLAVGDQIVGAFGSGVNASILVSRDGGTHFKPGGRALASEILDRCVVDDEGRAFTLSSTRGGKKVVISQGPGAAPQVTSLSEENQKLAALSCDGSALAAVLVGEKDELGRHPVKLRLCPFRQPCRDLEAPATGGDGLFYPVDVARLGGSTIISRAYGGVTRTTSSRDDGHSWSPWIVAYDAASREQGSADAASHTTPHRLLPAGSRVLLYSGSDSPGDGYTLIVSDDQGASFHAP